MTTLTASGAAGKSGTTAKTPWGKTPDGQQVDVYTLTNKNGVEATITARARIGSPEKYHAAAAVIRVSGSNSSA